ncbi:unnamed protein product [Alopecurus aequalis]
MKMALESVEALLEDAGRRSITDERTRLWLKRLKDAMYAISDMIDEFEADTQISTLPSNHKFSLKKHLAVMLQPCLTFVPKFKLANEMKTMTEHLKDITDQHKDFNLLAGSNASELTVHDERETISSIDIQIFGRNEERDRILAYLSHISITRNCSVLAIYGIGGLGKTTLAQMVYNSSQYKDYSRVWVYVSQTFDLMKIGNSIISQLSKEQLAPYTTMQMVQNTLLGILAGKEILVVLDDLWKVKENDWNKLMAMLRGEGSKLIAIVTTRSEDIAVEVSTNKQPHKLALLENEVCWSIIKKKSDFESKPDKEELKHIGMSIARKCGGVALAAQSLGFVLKNMNIRQWRSMLGSDIWSLSDSEDSNLTNVLASLMLSYSAMSKDLKLCFSYCAIFQKGHQIVKGDLIQQWISLAFIKPTIVKTSWDIGEGWIKQLLGLSFLQDSKSSLAGGVHLEDATLFTMHDLVHDLARSVLFDEIIVAGRDDINGGSCSRYALLNDCSKPLESPKIRALRFMDCGGIEIDGAAFSSAKSLRILDLSECSIQKLPESIGVLKQLRYLNAPKIQDRMIPDSITRLSKLTYLNLHGSSAISSLPESIGDIEGLCYLNLSGCSGIEKLPESLWRLTKLVHLDLSNCSRVRDVSKFLGSFSELKYLNLAGCKNLEELPTVIGNLIELRYLNLSRCVNDMFVKSRLSKVDSFINSISALSNLEHLDLSDTHYVHSIPASFHNLRKLHTLNLSNCQYLKIPDSICAIDSLKILYVNSVSEPPQLGSNAICLPHFVVYAGESSSNLVLLQHTDPVELHITRLENVKSAEEARKIELIGKQSMERLELKWTKDAERSVDDEILLEKLVPPITLNNLEIRGYNSVNFPAWLVDITHYLPNLVTMSMCGLPKCKSLPSMHQLPNLKCLYLIDMASLEEWNTSYSSDHECVFEAMNIYDCPKLRINPLLPRAKKLRISHSDGVLSSWGEYTGASTTSPYPVDTTLHVQQCEVPMHQWRLLQHLPGLTHLEITDCGDLTASPEIIRHLSSLLQLRISECSGLNELHESMELLTNLQSLILYHCSNIASLPHWLGKLISLKKLGIRKCYGLRSLPEGIQQLTNLQELEISRCTALEKWCESEENKMKLTPNQEKACVLPTSLKKLEILSCRGISSLPEGIQQLTNLQELRIYHCPALKEWCELEDNQMNLTPNHERVCALPISLKKLEIVQHIKEELAHIKELPKWLGELTSLQDLEISGFSGPTELHKSMRLLTNLQSLKLSNCTSITSLPQWLGELTSLKKLEINGCDGISSLPDGIKQLTNLQELRVAGCPALKKWCKLKENKAKLAHIKDNMGTRMGAEELPEEAPGSDVGEGGFGFAVSFLSSNRGSSTMPSTSSSTTSYSSTRKWTAR